MNFDKLKYATFSFYSLSIVIDHITTNIGISNGLVESNTVTHYLIEAGLWSFFDLAICMCLVLATHIFIVYTRSEYKFVLFFPLITGVIRLLAGMWNISLIM